MAFKALQLRPYALHHPFWFHQFMPIKKNIFHFSNFPILQFFFIFFYFPISILYRYIIISELEPLLLIFEHNLN